MDKDKCEEIKDRALALLMLVEDVGFTADATAELEMILSLDDEL